MPRRPRSRTVGYAAVITRSCTSPSSRARISSNRAAARSPLVVDRGPARCPTCKEFLEFRTDRFGRMVEFCPCGYRAYVERRSGKRDESGTSGTGGTTGTGTVGGISE